MTGNDVHFVNFLILKNIKKIGHFWWNDHKEAKSIQEGLGATLRLKKDRAIYFISPCTKLKKNKQSNATS